jgi:hypothetical protein
VGFFKEKENWLFGATIDLKGVLFHLSAPSPSWQDA